jgi:hypothetical protein
MKPARTSVRISTTTVLFAACTAAAAQSPQLSFRAGVPPAPRYVGAADLDGDGDLDLATRNPVQFAANDGAGRFALTDPSAPSGTALPLPEPTFVFDDFDGDGTPDVLRVSNGVANLLKAELFRGSPGAGPSATPLVSSLPNIGIFGNTYPAIVSASGGDLDGDGDLDLVVGRYDVPAAYPLVLFNLGNGTFTLSPNFFGLVPVGGGVCVGVLRDLDADGDFDWAVAGTTTLAPGGAFVQWNVGGVFGSPVVVLPAGLANNGKRVDCGDVDGDGRLDLAVFGDGGGAVARQTAPGVFGPVDLFANPGAAPPMSGGGCLGDFEGDGVPEAVVVGPTGVFVHRFAAGAFVQVAALPRPGIEALAFDADGDGDDDLLVEQYAVVGSGVPLVKSMPLFFSGGGVPQFEPDGLLDVPFGYSRHVPVDMNADGVPDLFGYGATPGGIRPHTTTNDGLGSFGPRVDYPCAGAPGVGPQTVGAVVHGITPFDLDGDGQREFLVTDAFSGIGQPVDAVLAADANGGYVATPLTGNAIPNQAITRARSVDLDADGDDDLLVVLADGFARVRWSSGGSLGVGILLNAGASDGVVAGDYDDDGDLDVVTASSAHFHVFVQGPAGWTFGPLVAGGGAPHAVDVDGDGMTDLVVGDSYYRRTGPLAFAPPLPATGIAGLDVAVTLDVDGGRRSGPVGRGRHAADERRRRRLHRGASGLRSRDGARARRRGLRRRRRRRPPAGRSAHPLGKGRAALGADDAAHRDEPAHRRRRPRERRLAAGRVPVSVGVRLDRFPVGAPAARSGVRRRARAGADRRERRRCGRRVRRCGDRRLAARTADSPAGRCGRRRARRPPDERPRRDARGLLNVETAGPTNPSRSGARGGGYGVNMNFWHCPRRHVPTPPVTW